MANITEQTKQILERALAHVDSVKYKVSLRWIFYRLLQDGIYKSKEDYNKCKPLFARVRKQFKYGFTPDTFADDTRKIIWRGVDSLDKKEWIEDLKCNLDKIQNQDYVLLIFYEAKAMTGQFQYYTDNIPLVAFGGDASIPYKWEIAKAIEGLEERYKKPIKVLYFGDADSKGAQIYKSALKDIVAWCNVQFDVEHCGLTIEQAKAFNLPSNPEKPNQYQWEALTDEQAMAIITENVEKYQDKKRFEAIEKEQNKILSYVKKKLGVKDART